MKEIFDYCISKKPEEHKDYQLISIIQDYLDYNIYKSLYDFYFLIRNDNNLMLKIINLSDKYVYEELSDFLVNFFYENVINSSFIQEELIIMIYLLLENLFLKIIPDDFNNINNIYITYINSHFLFYVFKCLTRKIDVRNYLYSILNDIIFRLESFRIPLSVDINIANRFLRRENNLHHSFIKFAKGDNDNTKIIKTKKFLNNNIKSNIAYNLGIGDKGSAFLKRTKKIELGSSNNSKKILGDSWFIIHSKLSQSKSLNDSINNINNEQNVSINRSKAGIDTEINEEENTISDIKTIDNQTIDENNNIEYEAELSKDIDINLKIKQEREEIDPFFENISVTLQYINNKILDLRKSLNKNAINNAMKEYLKSLIEQLETHDKLNNQKKNINNENNNNYIRNDSSETYYENIEKKDSNNNNDKEIFSTSLIIEELINIREIKQADSFKQLMRKIIRNYTIVKKIIGNIINKIKENLICIPYILKIIMKMFDILLEKKYKSSSKNKLSYYNLYMLKINFIIGNILLPIITEPEYNGIVTNEIISQITNDNLKLITNIFNKILSGQLFNKNEDPYMTLFNQFIIEIIPTIFELVENIEKNIKLPRFIQKLINTINNEKRNINYNFFEENQNENIQYQSVCFSWQNLYILLQIIIKNKDMFINDDNIEQKLIIEKLLEYKDKFINLFGYGIKNQKCEFFILTKINYKNIFEKKLKSIINDNFNLIIPKLNDDLITAYKKCLTEVLGYVNIVHKENFNPFTFRKDKEIYDKDIIKIISKNNRKCKYEKIINNKNYLINDKNKININLENMPLSFGDKEDADFKNSIFPQILDNINYEISYNLDNEISQKIIFCCNYLKLYMRNIPNKYIINNFDLLLKELIKETENNIEYLKNNALFEFYLKIKEAEKLNVMISNYNSQIRNIEKLKCIEYLYNKLTLPVKFNITKDQKGIITSLEYIGNDNNNNNTLNKNKSVNIIDYLENRNQPIKNFIDEFPDFHNYEEEIDNILDIEEKANAPEAINSYFKSLKNLLKKEKIINRFNKTELDNLIYDLENFILTKLYNKLYPYESTKDDIFFYKKCSRLSFIKPENVVSDQKLINENLMEKAIEYVNDIDDKLTPADKIKCFSKAIEIIQNSIFFSSGKDELGVDDIIKPLIYIIIKSKPKNICSNFQYCELYLNSELSKKQYGVILAQIGLIIGIIKKMKYNDLIGVSEKEFGIDEILEDDENDITNENKKEEE